ncbi:tetratricopeptide repeat protein [Saccharothrix carnea]|uniref:Tetratricopeptide repeat protein n=1 Tax=Saccharothrix carnea TaxID=1280637 RepID=A0A2P8I334_SACCR|nr:FxSxx-COOH system tetratricopeptide repeat protein [Saccharothrix carnea]PSL52864.1 tetratricopeptide repeat protein [Saccharothrix carnea]
MSADDPLTGGSAIRLTVREVRDALWLASRMSRGVSAHDPPAAVDPPRPAHLDSPPRPPSDPPSASREVEVPPVEVPDRAPAQRGSSRARAAIDASAALLPAVPALPERTRIARALRPLARTAPSPWREVLDEEATAVRAAQDGLWLPEWRPEPWHPFDVALVVDGSPSMAIWQHTARELAELLRRQGAFRDVRRYGLDFSPATPEGLRLRPEGPTAAAVPWNRLADPTGRRLVLVFTDGIGDAWRSGAAGHVLHHWGRVMPVAVVHALDQRLWQWSALDTRRVRLSSPSPGAPNRLLRSTPAEPAFATPPGGTVVPVLALSPEWMAPWARLVTEPGSGWVDTTATVVRPFDRDTAPEPARPPDVGARERVLGFRTVASITAFRLASLLAAAPLDLSSMKLVQRVMLPGSGLSALAEVMLGGLLVRKDGGAGPTSVRYDFHPGVREELLAGLQRADTVRVVRLLADHAPPEVTVLHNYADAVDTPDDVELPELSPGNAPYLRVQEAVFRALSGPYLARANRLAARGFGAREEASPEPGRRRRTPLDHRPEVWGPMPLRNPDFVGREELLAAVRRRLAEPSTAVLHGMGGVGKSQAAVEYVYRHASEYQVVWWIPAEHPAQVRTSFVELAKRLGVPAGSTDTAVSGVLQALRDGGAHARWMLVFDNADHPDELRPFFPTGDGDVLVTSRNPVWASIARPVEVDLFTRAESVELLRRRAGELDDDEADALAEALNDLPLAVEQAAAWRAQTGMAVEEYLDLLAENRDELRDAALPDDAALPIAAAWRVPLSRLAEDHPAALHLLQVCAFFGAEPIPQRLFRGARDAPVSPELVEAMEDPVAFNRAIREISRYSLARIDHRNHTMQLHHVVQAVLSSRVSPRERDQLRHAVHMLLVNGDPGDPSQAADWPRYAELVPHAVQAGAVECQDKWVRRLLINLVRYMLEVGDFSGAVEMAERSVAAWRAMAEDDDLRTLEMARLHGVGLRRLGRIHEARSLNVRTYAALRRKVGDDHEDTLNMLDTVAADRRREGSLVEELRLRRLVHAKARRMLGEDDPETLRYANNLAASLRSLGQFAQARELDEDTVRRFTDVLGADHLMTLRSRNALAVDLRECGDYGEAWDMLDDTLLRQRELFGEDHLYTIGAARALAVTRCRAGDHVGARELAEECLARYRRRQGESHLDTITSLMTLSVDLRHLDDLPAARDLAERSHRLFSRTSGAEHPFTMIAATNLAVTHRLSGDPDLARRLNTDATATLRRVFSADHPFALVSATNLAGDLAALGDHAAARELDEDTLRRSGQALGPRHPSTLAVALNLSLDLADLGDHAAADPLHRQAVTGLREVLGGHHPATRSAARRVRANCDIDTMEL